MSPGMERVSKVVPSLSTMRSIEALNKRRSSALLLKETQITRRKNTLCCQQSQPRRRGTCSKLFGKQPAAAAASFGSLGGGHVIKIRWVAGASLWNTLVGVALFCSATSATLSQPPLSQPLLFSAATKGNESTVRIVDSFPLPPVKVRVGELRNSVGLERLNSSAGTMELENRVVLGTMTKVVNQDVVTSGVSLNEQKLEVQSANSKTNYSLLNAQNGTIYEKNRTPEITLIKNDRSMDCSNNETIETNLGKILSWYDLETLEAGNTNSEVSAGRAGRSKDSPIYWSRKRPPFQDLTMSVIHPSKKRRTGAKLGVSNGRSSALLEETDKGAGENDVQAEEYQRDNNVEGVRAKMNRGERDKNKLSPLATSRRTNNTNKNSFSINFGNKNFNITRSTKSIIIKRSSTSSSSNIIKKSNNMNNNIIKTSNNTINNILRSETITGRLPTVDVKRSMDFLHIDFEVDKEKYRNLYAILRNVSSARHITSDNTKRKNNVNYNSNSEENLTKINTNIASVEQRPKLNEYSMSGYSRMSSEIEHYPDDPVDSTEFVNRVFENYLQTRSPSIGVTPNSVNAPHPDTIHDKPLRSDGAQSNHNLGIFSGFNDYSHYNHDNQHTPDSYQKFDTPMTQEPLGNSDFQYTTTLENEKVEPMDPVTQTHPEDLTQPYDKTDSYDHSLPYDRTGHYEHSLPYDDLINYDAYDFNGHGITLSERGDVASTSSHLGKDEESTTTHAGPCQRWQHTCADGACIETAHYCDGVVHCADYSDELPGCTACNRRHQGRVGRSYVVSVPSLPSERAPPAPLNSTTPPPSCSLTFTAAGGGMGDIVQLTFQRFNVGEYTGMDRLGLGTAPHCRGGYITIGEGERRDGGGVWCGEGDGTNNYYSEGSSVTVTVETEEGAAPPSLQIRYRFISKSAAVVRYGSALFPKYRGEPVSNTACSRILQGCRAKSCVLQSPNFPGFYPRNVTCYYLVKALPAPSAEFKPLIAIGQPNNRLIHVGDHDLLSRVSPEVSMHKECPGDHISIYDGGEMKAPLLARFCGSTSLPNITSSGSEMLVVFHAAAAGRMNHPPNMVVGFELVARILFKKQTPETGCLYKVSGFSSKQGIIHSPSYSMPSNSTCVYKFNGKKDEIVWLYFSKYYRKRKYDGSFYDSDCRNGLTILDDPTANGEPTKNVTTGLTIGRFCDEMSPPVCIRSRQKHRLSIPCSEKESFVSKTPNVVVTQKFTDGTSLMPLDYILHYEYVTVDKQTGQNETDQCNAIYSSNDSHRGKLFSPKSVFKYGRGGATSLNCTHTFHIREEETLKLKITSLNFKNGLCKSSYNYHYDAHRCLQNYPNSATLTIAENVSDDVQLDSGCLCDNKTLPIYFTSHAKSVVLTFTVQNMTWSQDHTDFSFEAEYKYEKSDLCHHNRVVTGNNGIIPLGNSTSTKFCDLLPWTIYGRTRQYIYMSVPGSHPSSSSCNTNNRIVVFYDGHPAKSICPSRNSEEGEVAVFSSGWHERGLWHGPQTIVFRYIGREVGHYTLRWLEITRDPQPPALESIAASGGGTGGNAGSRRQWSGGGACPSECPELAACINSSLWCDGYRHCPSGADESSCNPSRLAWLQTLVLLASGTAISVVAVTVLGITATHVVRQQKVKERKKRQAQQIMTQEVLIPLAAKTDSYFMS